MTSNYNIGKLAFKTEKARDRFIKKYTELVSRYGYTKSDIEHETQKLTDQFNKEASFGDAIWSLLQQKGLEIATSGPVDLSKLSYLYFDKSLFLAESGENPFQTLQAAQEYLLKDFQQRWTKVRVSSASFGCEHCQELNEKVFTIKDALKLKILPNKNCTSNLFKTGKYPWCTCHFVAVP